MYTDEPTFEEVLARVQLWSNKGLDSMYQSGFLLGAKNKLMEWKIGNSKESCKTCLAANGQVHRAKEWKKYGLMPRADKLICGGFKCQCSLEETTKKATGRLDRIPIKK